MDQFLQEHVYSLVHWPWFAVMAILTILGQFFTLKVFTRERAYAKRENLPKWWAYIVNSAFWWGRESQMLHPIIAGLCIGYMWPDPEAIVTSPNAAAVYFGSSGVASLFAWMYFRSKAKKKGIDLTLPGTSQVPPAPEK